MDDDTLKALGITSPVKAGSNTAMVAQLLEQNKTKAADLATARNKEEAPIQSGITQAMQARQATAEKGPERQDLPKMQKPNATDLTGVFGALLVFAALAGGQAKAHATGALRAMNGVLEGMHAGDQEKVAQAQKQFETDYKRAVETNKEKLDDYKRTLENMNLGIDMKIEQLRQIAIKYQDQEKLQLLDRGDISAIAQAIHADQQATQHAQDRADRLAMQREQQTKWEPFTGKDGKTLLYNPHTGEIKEASQDLVAKPGTAGKGAGGGSRNLATESSLSQDVSNAGYNFGELMRLSKEHGALIGYSPRFAANYHGEKLWDAARRWVDTKVLPADLQLSDKILLNFAFDIASAQSGGRSNMAQAKVREVEQQMPPDSAPDDVKLGAYKALLHRAKAANNTLPKEMQVDVSQWDAMLDQIGNGGRGGKGSVSKATLDQYAKKHGMTNDAAAEFLRGEGYAVE